MMGYDHDVEIISRGRRISRDLGHGEGVAWAQTNGSGAMGQGHGDLSNKR